MALSPPSFTTYGLCLRVRRVSHLFVTVPIDGTTAVSTCASSRPTPIAFFPSNPFPLLPIHPLSLSAIPHHMATSCFQSAAPAALDFAVVNGPSSYCLGMDSGVADLVPAGDGVITRILLFTTPHAPVSRMRRGHLTPILPQKSSTTNRMDHPPYHPLNHPSRIFRSPLPAGAVSQLTSSTIPHHVLLRHCSSLSTPIHAAVVGVLTPEALIPPPNHSPYLVFEQRRALRLKLQLVWSAAIVSGNTDPIVDRPVFSTGTIFMGSLMNF